MSDGPLHAGPQAEPQAARESDATPVAGVPAAPVPLVTVPTLDGYQVPGQDLGADAPLTRLRRVPASTTGREVFAHTLAQTVRRTVTGPASTAVEPSSAAAVPAGFAGVPTTLDELMLCTDQDIARLAALTEPRGGLMTVLKGAFEADWFRAKDCLVFDKWPGHRTPAFGHAASLTLMTGLTVLRGAVHNAVKPLAQARVKTELSARAAQLKGNRPLADQLSLQRGLPGAEQVEFKGSVGADTVTSDVDVSTGGVNSELAVRAYNQAFREYVAVEHDPGTVFDLNVYAKDFIHGFDKSGDGATITPKTENAEKVDKPKAEDRDREQDIWSLVHVARYLPADEDWEKYVADGLKGLAPDKRADQQQRYDAARRRAKGFEHRLLSMMDSLATTLDLGLGESSAWGADADHYEEGALRMRAANKIYEDKLLQVKELRTSIELLRQDIKAGRVGKDGTARLEGMVARLDDELSMAQLYANEVYGSGGATVHAVIGMQLPKKLSTPQLAVTAKLPKPQLYQSFNDNLGDVLKDFEHYGRSHGHGEPDYWYAAFKMGKYANRMVDCLDQLADGKPDDVIELTALRALAADPHVVALRELARHHLVEKDGDGGRDPVTLKRHPYFGTMNAASLVGLRAHALGLGATVRSLAASKATPTAVAPADPETRGARAGVAAAAPTVTSEQLERMAADVRLTLTKVRKANKEAAAPKG